MIGVTGFRGRLGSEVLSQLGMDAVKIDCDIADEKSVQRALDGQVFDAIINCAAYTKVDDAQDKKNLAKAYAVNSYGPEYLAKYHKGYLIHFSSDYIFDGKDGPYDEDETANPINTYGLSKYGGEVNLRPYLDRTLIVRTTILYDHNPNNFVMSVYNQLKDNKIVRVPRELVGNPTYVPHLVHGVIYCLDNRITGILNIAGKSRLSRYQMAREIALMNGFDTTKIITTYAWGAKRPNKAGFVLAKASEFGVPLYSYWEGLDALRVEMGAEPWMLAYNEER